MVVNIVHYDQMINNTLVSDFFNVSHDLDVQHQQNHNNSSSQFNVTHYYDNFVPPSTVGIGIYDLLCSLPGLIVNCIFIAVVVRNHQLRKTLTLLVLLSCGDILICLGNFTLGLSDLLTYHVDLELDPYQCFYLRPHVNFFILGIQLQASATVLVAAERMVAVCYPYKYFKLHTKKILTILCIICLFVVLSTYFIAIILSKDLQLQRVKDEACQPALVAGIEYGGFLYIFPAVLGLSAIGFYVVIFCMVVHDKVLGPRVENSSFSETHKRRQIWLLKIACILACTTFFFIVIPYILLFVRRYHMSSEDQSLQNLRRYVTFALSTNSFLGVSLCMIASRELRHAAKATLMCRSISRSNILSMPLSSFSNSSQSTMRSKSSSNMVSMSALNGANGTENGISVKTEDKEEPKVGNGAGLKKSTNHSFVRFAN